MARKRMIDPEFWSDEEIGKWSFQARLFYIGLWNFADDEGRLKAHNSLLKSEVFPYDKRTNMTKLKHEVAYKVIWYESNGNQYGFIKNFLKYQRIDRPTASKLPPPPAIKEKSTSVRRGIPANIREVKLREDKRREGECISVFWEYYLLKTKKKYKLDDERKKMIRDRLNDGYTLDQLKSAVDTMMADKWPGRAERLDLIYCIGKQRGKPDALEKWLNTPHAKTVDEAFNEIIGEKK